MPDVKQGESRNEYVSRAIPYLMKSEGLSQKAATGKAEGMFSSHQKKHHRQLTYHEIRKS